MLLEWTHGGSDDLHGVDLSVFLESSPEETKERRIRRNRVENAASPFICRVVELEQEKLEVQRKNTGFSVIDYDLNEQLADREDLDQLKNMGINLKLDFILNHASAQSPQFRDLVEKGEASAYRDFFIDWNHFWEGHGRQYLGQMDVNIQSPKVWEFYRETLEKIASYGAAIVRLDAFAYAPKAPGKKNFLNDPETWELLQKIHTLAEPLGLTLLPEIHAAYDEKIYETLAEKGYATYDFFLPGLVIDAIENRRGTHLAAWAKEIVEKKISTVNMLGCHDVIPLLDLKGLLPKEEIERQF